MLNKNERMNKLVNAGIDTGKYFNINLPEGLAPGATISVVINENGQPVVVTDNKPDPIAEQIFANGYVRNTKLHRRFVMAQMFQMLNYKSYDKTYEGYTDYLHRMYSYQYTFDMMLEEVKVLSRLEISDGESFNERSHFFTKEVVIEVLKDYMEKLKAYVNGLPSKNCKGVPYKRVKGENIFVEDLDKKLYAPLRKKLNSVCTANNYTAIHRALQNFMRDMIKLPYNTPKSKVWIDAFKGEGAYYTLKNLVMFHHCYVEDENRNKFYDSHAVRCIKNKLDEYQGEGWRMFALMKKVIEDNDFDFNDRMREIYSEK